MTTLYPATAASLQSRPATDPDRRLGGRRVDHDHRLPAGAPAPARVALIGGFRCVRNGREPTLPHGIQRLIALLGLTGRSLSRQLLATTLWPDVEVDHALGALRTAVWRLNRLCPGMVVGVGNTDLRLVAEVDLQAVLNQADRLLRAAAGVDEQIEELAQVFRGRADLLPGWYDDWVLFHRERLLAIRVEVLRGAAERLRARGRLPEALDLALAALGAEPLDEQLHILVATIHLSQGNASEALRQYELCAALLADELGVAPSDGFRALLPWATDPPGAGLDRDRDRRTPTTTIGLS